MLLGCGLAFLLSATAFASEPATPARPDVDVVLAKKIVNRAPVAFDEGTSARSGETVFLWTQVAGLSSGFIEHVWFRGDEEIARHYLPVGVGRRWRTWSRHKVSPGSYRVEVLGPKGEKLGGVGFDVAGPSGGTLGSAHGP